MKTESAVRPGIRPATLLTISALVFAGAGCSHTHPYVKPGMARFETPPEAGKVKTRFILVGDIGYLRADDPLIEIIKRKASEIPSATTLLFLGNNVPSSGFPPSADQLLSRVEQQLRSKTRVSEATGTKALFLAGNDDWINGRKGGLGSLLREQKFVNAQPGCAFVPFRGLAAPVTNAFDHGVLAILNTQWWLVSRGEERPPADPEMIRSKLKEVSVKRDDNYLLVAGHHPLRSYGLRQGYFAWRHWLFPLTTEWRGFYLPLPGVYPVLRVLRLSPQDLFSPSNCDMRQTLLDSLGQSEPWIYASGHEYGLQVIHDGKQYYLVSGGGSPAKVPFGAIWHRADTEFAQLTSGFMVLDYVENKAPFLAVIDGADGKVLFSKSLN